MASEQLSPASDLSSGDRVSEMQEEKPSLFNKVKAKARKLKSKMKDLTEDSHDKTPTSEEHHGQAYPTKSTDQDMDESDTTKSEGEGKSYDIPYTPLTNAALPRPTRPAGATVPKSEGSPLGAVASGKTGYGEDTMKTDDKSCPEDPSVVKSEASAGTEQAVPTNYSYFNADPEKANRPSDDSSQRKQEVPSSLSEEPAGLTPEVEKFSTGTENPFAARDSSLSKSGDMDSELPRPFSAGDDSQLMSGAKNAELSRSFTASQESAQENEVGLVEPSQPSEDSLVSHPVEQDQGLKFPQPSSHPLTPPNSMQNENTDFSGSTNSNDPSTDKVSDATPGGWTASNPDPGNTGGAGYANASAETDQQQHHQGYEGLAAATAGAAGAGGVAAGVDKEFGSSRDQAPIKDEDDNSLKLAAGNSEETGFQPAHVSSETGSEILPTSESGNEGSNKDRSFTSGDSEETGFQPAHVSNETGSETLPASESGTGGSNKDRSFTSSQGEDLGQDKSGIAAGEAQQNPMTSKLTESAYGLKDTVDSKLGYGDQAMSSDSTPVSQKATDSVAQGEDYATHTLNSGDQAVSSDEKPASEKAAEATSQAKDATEQKTNPDHQDKNFAGSIPDSLSGQPGTVTSKLGLGEGNPTSSPTGAPNDGSNMPTSTTPISDASHDSSNRKNTHPDHPTTTAPGLFDRMSGIASSLFGAGAKQPATEGEKQQ